VAGNAPGAEGKALVGPKLTDPVAGAGKLNCMGGAAFARGAKGGK
jgi:hypothetical protein